MMASSSARPLSWVNRVANGRDAGLARNRRASASAPTRPHRHPGPAPVTAIFNFGQDNRTEETQKTEEATAPDGEQSNNVTNGGGPGGFFENAGAMFRSKSGGVGDVLEQNTGEGSDKNYGGDVAGVSNDDPIDGVLVDGHAAMDEAALLAADLKAGASPASSEDAMDDLYNEIAAKNGVNLDEQAIDSGIPPSSFEGSHASSASDPNVMFQPPPVEPMKPPAAQQTVYADPEVDVIDPEVSHLAENSPIAQPGAEKLATVTPSPMDALFDDLMLDSSLYDDDNMVETVQVVKVRFTIKKAVEFGEVLRMVGGHESMGSWSLRRSPALKWTTDDNWVSEDIELPIDGVYVYKYVVTEAGDASKPVSWQKGNNQVLTLRPEDSPALLVQDSWSGDPSKAYTSKMDGSDKMQSETRLVERIGVADKKLHEARLEVMDLKVEVRTAQLQSAALREEARLSSNVRLKLKQQLSAEKKRSEVLEEQVTEWKNKFKQLGSGSKPPPS
ncbi:carbohydrate-binding module family 20 protein [Micromonas commoda]|uniref:Carbohydrate-binding module family 20 protein n=1 Tax=Micromonas commoda (strain RCC299 / NOUM17 / CCMP2709) TaxID=296587 RepID=C1FFF7_MICCC|nr:carbohydrate-binding module family 20 protein [Micromonas commoda]ACO69361.1 carbohydrate-binding module family 20 protein [Micromonas commoda]|eukprot:XP_002508103.1 carbohydrate-binding module family 20 protein [Micromonas commoda]